MPCKALGIFKGVIFILSGGEAPMLTEFHLLRHFLKNTILVRLQCI
jgi:hypothetical protein